MTLADRTQLIVVVKVDSFLFAEHDSTKRYAPPKMRVDILEILKGKSQTNRIQVQGQDGINCLEWLTKFEIGKTYVLSLYVNNHKGVNEVPNFSLSGCGDYWLTVQGSSVKGLITKQRPDGYQEKLEELEFQYEEAKYDEEFRKAKKLKRRIDRLINSSMERISYDKFKTKLLTQLSRSS